MPRIKATFPNASGEQLSGLLELPEHGASSWAIFAHCFTCSKDIAAASRITRALATKGVAVLRFDFTGLGNSDGDFANSNFSSNLDDLVHAADYMRAHHGEPELLIGHSLGGAAVLAAAHKIDSIKAVVTIGAPSTAEHVEHLFSNVKEKIIDNTQTEVNLGGRLFTIKKQFIDDISTYNNTEHIAKLNRALLIFHSPIDETVSIDEAAKIYQAARHPKSFISLENADHLLSKRADSEYVAEVIGAWASRYLNLTDIKAEKSSGTAPELAAGHVVVWEHGDKLTRRIFSEDHQLIADEPRSLGGDNLGANPYELLLASLGACTSMTIRLYANRKNIPLDNVTIELVHSRVHANDCTSCESNDGYVDKIEKIITLEGTLSNKEKNKLLHIADKCPVHKTLHKEIVVDSRLS